MKPCERGLLDVIIYLGRRAKFTVNPSRCFRCHRISVNLRFMDVSASDAFQRPVLKSRASRGCTLNKRGGLASRTAGVGYRAGRQSR